ncbi:MAG: hypothetical protein HFF08_04010 [Oscillospiraceae bacterium]|nr:hypothetical protein [Oscillospiraceae bacterium]
MKKAKSKSERLIPTEKGVSGKLWTWARNTNSTIRKNAQITSGMRLSTTGPRKTEQRANKAI